MRRAVSSLGHVAGHDLRWISTLAPSTRLRRGRRFPAGRAIYIVPVFCRCRAVCRHVEVLTTTSHLCPRHHPLVVGFQDLGLAPHPARSFEDLRNRFGLRGSHGTRRTRGRRKRANAVAPGGRPHRAVRPKPRSGGGRAAVRRGRFDGPRGVCTSRVPLRRSQDLGRDVSRVTGATVGRMVGLWCRKTWHCGVNGPSKFQASPVAKFELYSISPHQPTEKVFGGKVVVGAKGWLQPGWYIATFAVRIDQSSKW